MRDGRKEKKKVSERERERKRKKIVRKRVSEIIVGREIAKMRREQGSKTPGEIARDGTQCRLSPLQRNP